VRPRKPRPGGFGHHVRRYYGRCAGCFRWTGTGARRVTPPRATSQETWPEVEKPRPRNLGQSRGGAPRGERARSGRSVQTDFPWRAPRPKRERVATAVGVARSIFSLRLPALRLPLILFGGETSVAFVLAAKLGRGCVARMRLLSATAIAGEGDHWSSRSERTVVEGALAMPLRCRCRRMTAVRFFV
jgi:hypothetical protein